MPAAEVEEVATERVAAVAEVTAGVVAEVVAAAAYGAVEAGRCQWRGRGGSRADRKKEGSQTAQMPSRRQHTSSGTNNATD